MKKKTSFICHLITTVALIVCALLCFIEASVITGTEYEGWHGLGAGIGAAIMIILGLCISICFLLSIIPTIVAFKGIYSDRKRYFITNQVFEIILFAIYSIVAIGAPSLPTFLIYVGASAPIVIAFICNVRTLKEL